MSPRWRLTTPSRDWPSKKQGSGYLVAGMVEEVGLALERLKEADAGELLTELQAGPLSFRWAHRRRGAVSERMRKLVRLGLAERTDTRAERATCPHCGGQL